MGEDPLEKVRRRRSAEEGPPEKIRWGRSNGEDPIEKVIQRRGLTPEPNMTLSRTNYGSLQNQLWL